MKSSLRRDENHLEATECLIALIICSTCFGHLYAHFTHSTRLIAKHTHTHTHTHTQ